MAVKRPNKDTSITDFNVQVLKAREFKWGITLDLQVNGITIYGCVHKEGVKDGKPWSMITFPSYKGSDGKYYNNCWFPISNELKDEIEKQISDMLS